MFKASPVVYSDPRSFHWALWLPRCDAGHTASANKAQVSSEEPLNKHFGTRGGRLGIVLASTPQLPFKRSQIPSYGDHKALNGGTLVGVLDSMSLGCC